MRNSMRHWFGSSRENDKAVTTGDTCIVGTRADEEAILDAVVVGSGWSGLGAGRYFWEQSQKRTFQFCILEAHERIGGRSKTLSPICDDYPNSMMEVGSQWIHGAHRRNRVYRLALMHDMILHYDTGDAAWDSAAIWVDKKGTQNNEEGDKRRTLERMDPDLEKELHSKMLWGKREGFYPFLFKYPSRQKKKWKKQHRNNATAANHPPPASVRDVYEAYCRERNLSAQDKKYLDYLLEIDFTQNYAGSVEDIDAEYCDHDKEYSGGDLHFGIWKDKADRGSVKGGYSVLIQKYAAPLLQGNLIRCNCKVTRIDTGSDPVEIEYEQTASNQEGKTNTTTQHRILARAVLCTVPLGVLKKGSIQFTPNLPPAKTQAIQKLGMGTYNKVVFLWNPDQRSQLPWLFPLDQSKSDERNGKDEDATEKATRHMWMERVSLPGEPQGPWSCCYTALSHQGARSPILLYFFLGGRMAQRVESLTDDETQQKAMTALRDWFNDPTIPEPEKIIATRWHQDPFTQGSYSFYKVGSSPQDRKELSRPLPNKRLFFAGEACHIKYFATTHGALQTGQETARVMWNNHLRMVKQRRRIGKSK